MKHLIFKDSSSESHLNQRLNVGLEMINEILGQYSKTTLKPITDKATLQAFFADPVKFVSDQVQLSANLGSFKVNPAKLVDLIDEPEITNLLKLVKSTDYYYMDSAVNYGKFTKKTWEVDKEAWAIYVDQQVCHYAETKKEIAAYEAVQKLIDAIETLHGLGMKKEHLVTTPLNATLLKYQGESNPIAINLHGFNQLAKV